MTDNVVCIKQSVQLLQMLTSTQTSNTSPFENKPYRLLYVFKSSINEPKVCSTALLVPTTGSVHLTWFIYTSSALINCTAVLHVRTALTFGLGIILFGSHLATLASRLNTWQQSIQYNVILLTTASSGALV